MMCRELLCDSGSTWGILGGVAPHAEGAQKEDTHPYVPSAPRRPRRSSADAGFRNSWPAALTLAVGLATALLASSVRAEESGWTEMTTRQGVTVFARPMAGSAFSEFRGVSDFEATPEQILAVLEDVESYTQTIPSTSVARLLKREGQGAFYYMEINPPLIARRDYCIRVGTERQAPGRWHITWLSDNAGCLPEQRGVVRVPKNNGEWILESLDGGRKTHVTYRCHIEVGGRVPAWMVNRASVSELPNIFASVRRAVSQPRYAACTAGACRPPH